MKVSRASASAYRTKDGSLIRELMHPDHHPCRNLSLAEAVVEPGGVTELHRHNSSEEIYHVCSGEGVMTLGREEFPVRAGDTICIPPATLHRVRNSGSGSLKILCCCAPAYSHDDTEILPSAG